jgi:hypothetical protein
MATYVNDLRLKEISTGDESGTWGTSTNTNLELIGEAFSFGTEAITTNADTHTTTIADGATDPGRSIFLKYTGALDSDCTVTIGPNTVSKLWFIENATTDSGSSGPYNIIIKQGSGATVTVPNGNVKAIYSDGAGSGGKMVDAFTDLHVDGSFFVTTSSQDTGITVECTNGGASAGPSLKLDRNSAGPADNDDIGEIEFIGRNDAAESIQFARIATTILDASDGTEDGELTLSTIVAGTNRSRAEFGATETVFNEASQDLDFRIESDLNTHRFFLDAGNDRIIFGSQTSISVGGSGAEFQINGTTGNSSAQSITRFGNDSNSPILKFGKSRNGTIGSNTIVQSGDNLGIIQFCGDDGTNLGSKAADILSEVDGTPGSDDMPGRILFRTTADGADSTTERMRITKDGLVGIGTASPNEPLHVFHATRNVLVNIESGDSGAYISFKDDDTTDTDTVFIGAVDNDLKLYAGGSTDRLAIIGSNGTIQTRTAGSNNVRLGLDAGGNIGGSGDYNTFIGDSAGAALTTGDSNVAVGFEALATEDGHGRNVAIGYRALKTLNAGTNANNTVVGYGAGVLMTTATQNTFLGSLVGDEITTGGANVALGYNALSAETTSSRNVAVGALTLQNQNGTAGQTYNTAVGYNSGNDITTGARNTCVGGLSGDAMTTGTNNTFIGYNTGGTGVVTGADNTALGISAGASLTSGTNNVLIGHDAGVSGSPGGNINNESNEIVIGDDAITQAHIQVDWTVASDQRDKTDFVDLDLGLDFVKALEPVTYYWDKRSKYGDKYTTNEEGDLVLNEDYDLDDFTPDGTHKEDWMDIGFKAQAVQALEEAAGYTTAAKKNLTVSTTADGKQMGLQYSKFVPILVKAIQDQDAIITALTARIEALES